MAESFASHFNPDFQGTLRVRTLRGFDAENFVSISLVTVECSEVVETLMCKIRSEIWRKPVSFIRLVN